MGARTVWSDGDAWLLMGAISSPARTRAFTRAIRQWHRAMNGGSRADQRAARTQLRTAAVKVGRRWQRRLHKAVA
jgi:hypothetical protein